MSRLLVAALGAAVILSGCGSVARTTTTQATGIKLSTATFPNQLPSPCPFPNATINTAYSASITATGGIPPFRWDVAIGSSLPPGLVFTSGTPSATISGTPTQVGRFNFTLEVTDAEVPPVTASAEFVLTVNNPVPIIASLSPSSAIANGAAFTLTVNGSSFVSGAVVDWNGSARTTTFISPTQLTAAIPASDITAAGTANVTVVNPSPGGGASNSATFAIGPPFPQIVSVSTKGTQGNNFSGTEGRVATSADGRFVAFESNASNLAAVDNNQTTDVFVRDTCETIAGPVAGCTPSTTLVSAAMDGTAGNSASRSPSISADGRFVAFESNASNLVVGDTNTFGDVFVRDTCQTSAGPVSGCTPSTKLISVGIDATPADNYSEFPSISADGRFVAFDSLASNLVAVDNNQVNDVFVRDTCQTSAGPVAGCTPSTTIVSVASDGTQGNDYSSDASISTNGRYIAFDSNASNLVANDSNAVSDVFVRDTCAGVASGCTPSTVRVSVASDGTQADPAFVGDFAYGSDLPSISSDGRFVAFESYSANLVAGDTNSAQDVFVRDTCAGAASGCTPSTIRVSVASDGTQGNGASLAPTISAHGRFVAFESAASNLVSGDTNSVDDVFVRDTCAGAASGCAPATVRSSVAGDGTQGNRGSYGPAISGDGHFVAFPSSASNLVANDTNGFDDIFIALTSF